ncbi:AGAP010756-PA, partial [Anopheles gambiae str. PEST]
LREEMHTYSVPIVKHDIRHEETILDAINAFEYLNQVVEDVFGKINARIERNRARLEAIDGRVEQVSASVRKLHETKQAIIIYSPSRYPAADVDPTIEPTFTPTNGIALAECHFRLRDKPYLPSHSLQEKIQFYHVKSPRESERIFPFESAPARSGSGSLQGRGLGPFLDTLLLFSEPAYVQQYRGQDWKRPVRKSSSHAVGGIREEKVLSSSSPIIRSRMKKKSQDIFYTPSLNDAPKLDVPIDLPDLPGIVSNINYVGNSTLIAPSLQLAGIIEQLPSLEDLTSAIDVADHHSKEKKVGESVPMPVPPIARSAPETVLTAHPLSLARSLSKPWPVCVSQFTATAPATSKPEAPKQKEPLPAPAGNAHFNLMEAIRRAGGAEKANLRHSDRREGGGGRDGAASSGEPKSLIDDLHNKLQMRRKGISGTREPQEPQGNVIDRLSALIPPPAPKLAADASASESNEEDWE